MITRCFPAHRARSRHGGLGDDQGLRVVCRASRLHAGHLPAPGCGPGAPPLSPIGLTAACLSVEGGVKARFACTLTRHFDLCSLPGGQIGP